MADELHADQTPGFKVGEKKTIDEYQKLGESVLKQQAMETVAWTFPSSREGPSATFQFCFTFVRAWSISVKPQQSRERR
jgi:hypothetical protein